MNRNADIAVLTFGDANVPRPLAGLPAVRIGDRADGEVLEAAIAGVRRVVVVGADADLATVLTLLLRAGRLDVEVGYAPRRRTAATQVYRVPAGRKAARRARRGSARRVPLIRDETGTAIVGAAHWRPTDDAQLLHGEAVVDDAVLFDGGLPGAGRADGGTAGPAGTGVGWPVAPLAGRAGGAAGHHRCGRGPRRCAGASDDAAVDDLSEHRGIGCWSGSFVT